MGCGRIFDMIGSEVQSQSGVLRAEKLMMLVPDEEDTLVISLAALSSKKVNI